MGNCGQACPYNTLGGCKVKEYNAICPLYNMATPITEYKMTHADRIRAMSDEELAKEMLFFCPSDTVFKGEDTYEKPHYTGLDGSYYATSEEVISKNIEWLKQPVGDDNG